VHGKGKHNSAKGKIAAGFLCSQAFENMRIGFIFVSLQPVIKI